MPDHTDTRLELIRGPGRSADSAWNRPPAHASRSAVHGEWGLGRANHTPGAAVALTSTDHQGLIRPGVRLETYTASDIAQPGWTRPACPPHGSARRRTRCRRKWVGNGGEQWCLEGKRKAEGDVSELLPCPICPQSPILHPSSLLPFQYIHNSVCVLETDRPGKHELCHKIFLSKMLSAAWLVWPSG